MKKLFLLLLAAVMVFSLAACSGNGNNGGNGGAVATPAEGYDAEFTVYIGYGDEWEPFIDEGFNLEFSNSDDNVLAIKAYSKAVEFTGKQVGESIITAVFPAQNKEQKALVRVRAVEGVTEKINYIYNPPTDNYFILYELQEDGKTNEFLNAQLGDTFCAGEKADDYMVFGNLATGDLYNSYYESIGWELDPNYTADQVSSHDCFPLNAMEDFFVHYFRTSGYADSALSEKLTEYYIGKERVLGINCWVFDTQGWTTLKLKFWIDPSNGCCLKYENYDVNYAGESRTYTVTDYNLNFTEWPDNLKP